jgi:hypothetical protein
MSLIFFPYYLVNIGYHASPSMPISAFLSDLRSPGRAHPYIQVVARLKEALPFPCAHAKRPNGSSQPTINQGVTNSILIK